MPRKRKDARVDPQSVVVPLQPRDKSIDRRTLLTLFALAILPILVYCRATTFEFVNYDDWEYVRDNPFVTSGLTWSNVKWAFTTFAAANWHPLTYISLMLDSELFGMKGGAFHAVNVALHVANTLLVFGVMRALTGCHWQSAIVAALFGIHPQHVESVVWITERKDVLSVFFGLCAIGSYVRSVRGRSWKWYLASIVLHFCSLMSKPTLVTLPFLLLLLDWWPLKRTTASPTSTNAVRTWKYLVLEKLPYLLSTAIFCVVVVKAQGTAVAGVDDLSLGVRLANAAVAYVTYLYHMVWPMRLAVIYPHPGTSIPIVPAIAAAAFLLAVSGLVTAFWRSRPYLFVGWFWFIGTMVPMIGVVQVGMQSMADRYSYFPCIGLYLALTWLVAGFAQSHQRFSKASIVAGAIILLALTGAAWRQVGYWQDSETLFRHALDVSSENPIAHANLGQALHVDAAREDDTNKLDEAIGHYREAVRLDRLNPTVHRNLAQALVLKSRSENPHAEKYAQNEDLEEAVKLYRRGLELEPNGFDNDTVYYELGNLNAQLGRFDDAIGEYYTAIKLSPDYAAAYVGLSRALSDKIQRGRAFDPKLHSQAVSAVKRALEIQPGWKEATEQMSRLHRQFGAALASSGNLDMAIDQFRHSVKLAPDSSSSNYMLAKALAQKGQADEAIVCYNRAIDLRPESPSNRDELAVLHTELGTLLLNRGDRKSAVVHLQEAVRLSPDNSEAQRALEKAKSAT